MQDDGIYSHMKEVIENNIKMMDDDGYIENTLNSLELRLGNHCNLKCICVGDSSSRINSERLDIIKKYGVLCLLGCMICGIHQSMIYQKSI